MNREIETNLFEAMAWIGHSLKNQDNGADLLLRLRWADECVEKALYLARVDFDNENKQVAI